MLYFLAEKEQKAVAEKMRTQPFTLATDGSHDRQSDTQLYPIVVRLYDASLGRITDVVLSVPSCTTSCTGENIFHLLNDALTTRNIPCIAFESDSASVMIGRFKGVAAFVKKEQPTVYIQGCYVSSNSYSRRTRSTCLASVSWRTFDWHLLLSGKKHKKDPRIKTMPSLVWSWNS